MDRKEAPRCTKELVQRAQSGDGGAFDELVAKYSDRLESLIRLRLGRPLRRYVDVEDVLQETYMRAFLSIGRFEWRKKGCFDRWLAGIVRHVIQDYARFYLGTKKRAGERNVVPINPRGSKNGAGIEGILDGNTVSPSTGLRREERFDRLEAAFLQLRDDDREVILLARIERFPIKEIAALMDRSADAVSMLLHRALCELRKRFGSTDSFHLPLRRLGGRSPDERDDSEATNDGGRGRAVRRGRFDELGRSP